MYGIYSKLRYENNFAFFISCSDPNQSPNRQDPLPEWPLHTEGRREYLELSNGLLKANSAGYRRNLVGRGPRVEYCAFWNIYVPRLVATTGQSVDMLSLLRLGFIRDTEVQTPLDFTMNVLLPKHFTSAHRSFLQFQIVSR